MKIKYSPKREQILLTGKDLFWKFGIRRVTIEEICKEAGVSKMTYYKFFSNKMDLVKTIMEGIIEGAFREYRNIMDSNIPFTEKVVKTILLKWDQTKAMSSEFFNDYTISAEPEMVAYLSQVTKKTIQMITEDYSIAQKEGNIRKDLKVEFILYFLNHTQEMIHDEKLIALYDNPQDLIMEITRFFFYGVLDREGLS
jgi:AcrR family transcriptional regulator